MLLHKGKHFGFEHPKRSRIRVPDCKLKGIYTIVEEKTGIGAVIWGKLKSGVGWIALDDTEKSNQKIFVQQCAADFIIRSLPVRFKAYDKFTKLKGSVEMENIIVLILSGLLGAVSINLQIKRL